MSAASRSNHHPHALPVFTVAFTISLTILFLMLPLTSGESVDNGSLVKGKMVLGSKPPACVNKCLSCRPCVATLVVPFHKNFKAPSSDRDDDGYYLLSWKCGCGSKLFQP